MALVVLVGLPGAGKSAVGRRVAKKLQVEFVDTDQRIESVTGVAVGDLIRKVGVEEFRRLELAALSEVVIGDRVVATGGGIITSKEARELLLDQPTLWLRASPSALVSRVKGGDRPLLEGDPARRLEQLALERDDLYAEVSRGVVDAQGELEVTVNRVLAIVKEWSTCE